MKRTLLFLLFLTIPLSIYCEDKITATLFYSSHCNACLRVKEEILPPVKEKYKDKVEWKELETSQNEVNLSYLMSVAARFKDQKVLVPVVFVGDVFLSGADNIKNNVERALEKTLAKKSGAFSITKVDLMQVFQKFSLFTIMISGLIDGINPCAFAVIVFFVSFLAVYGYKKREIIWVGTFYCLGVFITYLLLGLGVFECLYAMTRFYFLIKCFYYFIAFFCFALAIFAAHDYAKFRQTGESGEMILQLPDFLKKKINIVIGSHLRDKTQRDVLSLAFSSLLVGFLVSILEAVCTGQVYVPTIVFILKNTTLKLKAFGYLLLYNFMFILPLITVFLLSFFGFSSRWFNRFLKNNLGRIKISLVVLFILLGTVILLIS